MTIDPKDISIAKLTPLLQGSISPRPIAFASTVDKNGNVNLSPFSFFNLVSLNPPMLVFSVSRRVRDNTTKHSYENILEVPEVVVNIVNYSMVQQTSLASTEYAKGVNEFVKAGLTPVASQKVKPPRVAESPVAFECLVRQVIPLGETPGAGNLIISEIILAHFSDDIFDNEGIIDPFKIDTVARMGGDWYCRAQGNAIFKVPKPLTTLGIGVDQIPQSIRLSKVLTGNDLGLLGNTEHLPDATSIKALRSQPEVAEALSKGEEAIHQLAKLYLEEGKVMEAWGVLLLK
ncbi:MAG TPA: flavin reductase family protein [Cyclobacteriaceae bacterium]|nr:flavin reductase family protein [Cyclobacteriaceae bacterium]